MSLFVNMIPLQGESIKEERISLRLPDNSLPLEDTQDSHLNARENGTDKLDRGILKTCRRTQRRIVPNSNVQLPCQLQSSGPGSIPLSGNDSP